MGKLSSLSMVSLFLISSLSGCIGTETTDGDDFLGCEFNDVNQIWNQYDEHYYAKRSNPGDASIEIADKLINNNEMFFYKFWDDFVFNENELDWSEDPYDDRTWEYYFHSLRMVSFLMNAYELNGNITYLEGAQWFIESWIEHNPSPEQQASTSAWGDHSTANRISTFIYFWDYYRDSEICESEFANQFLNSLSLHGEFTANEENYSWGNNHGIFQDRALMQLSVLFPNFEQSDEWLEISTSRLSNKLESDVTPSGVHKEHSTAYHYLVLGLFMDISKFSHYYNLSNNELDSTIYDMQEYLVHIAKPDGRVPMIGDSQSDYVLGITGEKVTNEHYLYLVSNGNEGEEIIANSVVYQDAGVAIFKNNWSNAPTIYFALFNAFHSSAHKQSDDLSFVLTYQQTDYFVDSGKYNYDESDPYRIYMRSIFAHNSIAVDGESYSVRDAGNVGKSVIEHSVISSNYSFVKASHTLYEGVKITRSVVFFNDGAIYFHDQIESDESHTYTQIFNVGQDVNVDDSDLNNVILSSLIDNSSLTLTQLVEISDFESYRGADDPVRGWQSTTFNELSPITNLNYIQEGSNVTFETAINLGLEIVGVENFQDGDTNVYVFTFDDNRTERIEIN